MMAKGWSFAWSFNGEWRRRKWQREGERELSEKCGGWVKREKSFLVLNKRVFSFSIILFKQCHMSPFEWSKKGPLSLLTVTHTQPQKWGKSDLWNAKILPRFACRFSGSSFSRFSASVGASFRKQAIYISKRSEWNPERGSEVGFVKF